MIAVSTLLSGVSVESADFKTLSKEWKSPELTYYVKHIWKDSAVAKQCLWALALYMFP